MIQGNAAQVSERAAPLEKVVGLGDPGILSTFSRRKAPPEAKVVANSAGAGIR